MKFTSRELDVPGHQKGLLSRRYARARAARYNLCMSLRRRFPRWVPRLLALVAVALIPWTLWLTFTLPSRHVTQNYAATWVGFDIALVAAFAATAWAALSRSRWLIAFAASLGTMLLCDVWF